MKVTNMLSLTVSDHTISAMDHTSDSDQTFFRHGLAESILNNHTAYDTILISSMAGFGKTTTVKYWLSTIEQPFIYLDLTDPIKTPAELIAYLKNNTFQDTTISKHNDDALAESMEILLRYAKKNNDVYSPLICVWDMGIQPFSETLLDFFIHCAQDAEKKISCIILSRYIWPTRFNKTLSNLKVLDQNILKLSEKEFFLLLKSEPSPYMMNKHRMLKKFYMDSQGWPIILYFLKNQSAQQILSWQPITQSAHFLHRVYDYIETQLIQILDINQQILLRYIALLPGTPTRLCAQLLSIHENVCQQKIQTLHELQLIEYSEQKGWYITQPLLNQFFQYRSNKAHYLSTDSFMQTAIEWYENHQMITHLIEAYLQLNDWQRATQLIEQHATNLIHRENWQTIISWAEKLPQEILDSESKISALSAWRYTHFNKSCSLPLLFSDHDLVSIPTNRASSILPSMNYLNVNVSHLSNISHAANEIHYKPMIKTTPPLPHNTHLSTIKITTDLFLSALKQISSEDFSDAYVSLKKLITTAMPDINTTFVFNGLSLLSLIAHRLGQSEDLIEVCEKVTRWATEHHYQNYPLSAWLQGALCITALESNHLSLAEFHWQSLSALLEEEIDPIHKFFVYYLKAKITFSQMKYDLAKDSLETAEIYLTQSAYHFIETLTSTAHLKASIYFMTEALEQTKSLLLHTTQQAQNSSYKISAYSKIFYIHLLIHNKAEKNRQLLELLTAAVQKHDFHIQTYYHTISAYFYHQQGDQKNAFQALDQAIALCEKYSYIRTLLDFGKPMGYLLMEAHQKDPSSCFKNQLYEAIKNEPYYDSLNTQLITLSKREKEILNLLSAGYSNKKMAQMLSRSEGTIKIHLHNIYKKLGATNRVQAIQKYADFL